MSRSKPAVSSAAAAASAESLYVSPDELAGRWSCARPSVDRITRRARLTRLCLGEGKNAWIRYIPKKVETYE